MNYYGITIGPIIETIVQANTPASLWYASYMFSELTKELYKSIEKLNQEDDSLQGKITIILPSQISEETGKDKCIGIGQYPDRILIRVEEESNKFQDKLEHIKKNIIGTDKDSFVSKIANDCFGNKELNEKEKKQLDETLEYIMQYIQIRTIRRNENDKNIKKDGAVIALNDYLDALELESPIMTCSIMQPFQNLFYAKDVAEKDDEGNNANKNLLIKSSHFFENIKNEVTIDEKQKQREKCGFTLVTDASCKEIRQLSDIACNGVTERKNDYKKYHYYALVQADGDNMGNYLKNNSNPEDADWLKKIDQFSKKCSEYTSESSYLVKEFGGTVIYAGGDDLLFLAPVHNGNSENIFDLIENINCRFNQKFKELNQSIKESIDHDIINRDRSFEKEKLSVSFGVSISNTKYPLYENIKKARNLLFGVAKETSHKNSIAISLRKGNSKEMQTCISLKGFNEKADSVWSCFRNMLHNFFEEKEAENKMSVYTSVLHKIKTWSVMFQEAACNDTLLSNLFQNFFDDIRSEKVSSDANLSIQSNDYINKVKELMELVFKETPFEDEEIKKRNIECVIVLLQIGKFFTEKATEGVDYE